MVLFDNSFLTLVLHPTVKRPPKDPATGRTVDRVQERVDLLLETLERDRETIIIPAPVLTEFLILIGEEDGSRLVTAIENDKNYQIESFDKRAAIELAVMSRGIRAKGGRRGDQTETWAKIQFDRQIVAIAKVYNVTAIYSDDKGLGSFAEKNGLKVVRTWELPLPEEDAQQSLFMKTLAETLESDPARMLGGQAVEPNGTKEGSNEKEPVTGTEEAAEPAVTGVSTVPRLGPASSLSPEERSGTATGEGEAGEG
jgi:predicted nucleic acid-binding protein